MNTQIVATHIIHQLRNAGFKAYFAGGWVRDFLMGHPSNDIDIATDAPPEKILDLFPRTILVGLSFGVVIVLVNSHQFEVSTFRKDFGYIDGRHPEHIEFSTPEEDAKRRDFTINGMFYDPVEEIVHDYVGGTEDIKKRVIKAIGNPHERFSEDRLRMIRAIRFAARFSFSIDQDTQDAIIENARTLFPAVAMERIWQEFNKMSKAPNFSLAIIEMYRLELLQVIFPALEKTGLNTIKKITSPYEYFPEECPTILYIIELFQNASSTELIEIGRYLKASNRDIKLIELITLGRELIKNSVTNKDSVEKKDWVNFYSHPDAELCLKVIAARDPKNKEFFLTSHEESKQSLIHHIERVQLGKPLVTAALLQAHGVSPGKPMGLLLKEAERMVINHNRDNAEEIIELLKQSSHWPNNKIVTKM